MNRAERNSNYEILRILSMAMILGLHYLNSGMGGGLDTTNAINHVIAYSLESVFISSVNCFVLISGYFLLSKRVTGLSKAVELYLLMVLYDLLLFSFAVLSREISFSWKELLYSLFPFFAGRRWFLQSYILLLLLVPFLNVLIQHLTKRSHAFLLAIQLMLFSVWPTFFPNAPIADNGYGIINFISLYLIATYLKKYAAFKDKRKSVILAGASYAFFTVIIGFCSLTKMKHHAWDYNNLFVIVASVSLFVMFLNMTERHNCRVNLLSETMFDVYIIHTSFYIRNVVYHRIMRTELFINHPFMIGHLFACILLQLVCFALIGWLRQILWKPTIGKWIRKSKLIRKEYQWEQSVFLVTEESQA